MNDCIFCKIVKGEIPSFKIWEDEDFVAFLSIAPISPGHTLLIPKKHSEYIFDMDDELLGKFLTAAKPVSNALTKALSPATGKIGIMVAGLEVPHTHLHLIPMNSEGDLNFSKANPNVSKEELAMVADKIKRAL